MSIYIKNFRTLLYCLPLISSTFFSSSAMAKIPPTAFKGISRYFKDRSFDPTLGQMALDVGEIHNIRFDGNFECGMLNGERSYIKDHSQSDAVWALEKLLFPSPAGHLTTETDSNSNFAKLVNDSQVISKLANYANGLRRHSNNKEAHPPKPETTRSEILLLMASDKEKELMKAWDSILESALNDENLKELKSLTKENELLEKRLPPNSRRHQKISPV